MTFERWHQVGTVMPVLPWLATTWEGAPILRGDDEVDAHWRALVRAPDCRIFGHGAEEE